MRGMTSKGAGLLLKGAAAFVLMAALVATARFAIYRSMQRRICLDPRFRIGQLIEIPEEPIALRSGTIEELLGLKEGDQNLFAFDTSSAERALLSHPLIETARLWRCPPSAISVSYRVRRPFAALGEWPELLLDKCGYLFPSRPHFTPKQLPKLSLGLPSSPAGAPPGLLSCQERGRLRGKNVELGLQILLFLTDFFAGEGTRIASLDVSSAFDEDLGRRGLALVLEDQIFVEGKPVVCQRRLRLSGEQWRAQLHRYRSLLLPLAGEELRAVQKIAPDQLASSPKRLVEEIDLRLPQLAYFKLSVEEKERSQ